MSDAPQSCQKGVFLESNTWTHPYLPKVDILNLSRIWAR